jgi:hypothetical protein
MAVAYERETGGQMEDAGLNAAYAEIIDSVHHELSEFVRKYAPKRLNEFDDLMEQCFWRYH